MLSAMLGLSAFAAQTPADAVDPFIGTDGTGHTFPGPSRPFGMIQPGPDNADTGWEFTSGYQ
jgi:putative alpha-1,2-mannosidase